MGGKFGTYGVYPQGFRDAGPAAEDRRLGEHAWRFAGAGDDWDAEVGRAHRAALNGRPGLYCAYLAAEVLGELLECAMDSGAQLSAGLLHYAGELLDVFSRPELSALGLGLRDADVPVALGLLERHWLYGAELTLALHATPDGWDSAEAGC